MHSGVAFPSWKLNIEDIALWVKCWCLCWTVPYFSVLQMFGSKRELLFNKTVLIFEILGWLFLEKLFKDIWNYRNSRNRSLTRQISIVFHPSTKFTKILTPERYRELLDALVTKLLDWYYLSQCEIFSSNIRTTHTMHTLLWKSIDLSVLSGFWTLVHIGLVNIGATSICFSVLIRRLYLDLTVCSHSLSLYLLTHSF